MWDRRPTLFIEDVEKQITDGVKGMAGEALAGVITRSPVDEGTFRANHRVAVGGDGGEYDASDHDEQGNATLDRGMSIIDAIETPFVRVTIYNLSPYGQRLEDGWSQQAPGGIYEVTAASLQEKYR
ncbi:hypothetical protein [Modicisalibacter coralii]|uniref:hypothetical protein n=1 Tax=Modicisalibacter coralii TaxID=2304602 RepID=UPI00100A2F81|nr:hypothetical protein [Halomonas coralii]